MTEKGICSIYTKRNAPSGFIRIVRHDVYRKPFALYVNGILNPQYESYQPQDLDRIFITSGSITEEARQSYIASVSDDACIYSKMPTARTPPTGVRRRIGTDCK